MKRLALAVLLLLVAVAARAQEMEPQFFKIFKLTAGADTTLLVRMFNVDSDASVDLHQVTALGWKNGSAGVDTVWTAQPNGWIASEIPASSDDAGPLRLRRLTEIARSRNGAPVDSAVVRVKVLSGANFYLYVWGE